MPILSDWLNCALKSRVDPKTLYVDQFFMILFGKIKKLKIKLLIVKRRINVVLEVQERVQKQAESCKIVQSGKFVYSIISFSRINFITIYFENWKNWQTIVFSASQNDVNLSNWTNWIRKYFSLTQFESENYEKNMWFWGNRDFFYYHDILWALFVNFIFPPRIRHCVNFKRESS